MVQVCKYRNINIFQRTNCVRVQHNSPCWGSLVSQHSNTSTSLLVGNCGKYLSENGAVHGDRRKLLLITACLRGLSFSVLYWYRQFQEICRACFWDTKANIQCTNIILIGKTLKLSSSFPVWLYSNRHTLVTQLEVSFSTQSSLTTFPSQHPSSPAQLQSQSSRGFFTSCTRAVVANGEHFHGEAPPLTAKYLHHSGSSSLFGHLCLSGISTSWLNTLSGYNLLSCN